MENRLEAARDWEVGLRGGGFGYKRLAQGIFVIELFGIMMVLVVT